MSHLLVVKIAGISFAVIFIVYQLYLLLDFSGAKIPLRHKILSVFLFLLITGILFLTIKSATD